MNVTWRWSARRLDLRQGLRTVMLVTSFRQMVDAHRCRRGNMSPGRQWFSSTASALRTRQIGDLRLLNGAIRSCTATSSLILTGARCNAKEIRAWASPRYSLVVRLARQNLERSVGVALGGLTRGQGYMEERAQKVSGFFFFGSMFICGKAGFACWCCVNDGEVELRLRRRRRSLNRSYKKLVQHTSECGRRTVDFVV